MTPPSVDLQLIVDDGRLTAGRLKLLFLVLLALFTDGYDISVISYAAPAISNDWSIPRSAMGNIFAAGLIGMIVGAAGMGVVADWAGRRKALLISIALSGLAMVGTGMARDLTSLAIWRFVTGLGAGAIGPIGIVLAGEYAPRRVRARVVAFMFLGLGGGGTAAAGFLAAALVPVQGWQSLFFVGGLIPLLLWVALYMWLPESLRFLYVKQRGADEILPVVRRLSSGFERVENARFLWSGETQSVARPSYHQLFSGGRSIITPLLWLAMFSAQLTAFSFVLWMPTMLEDAGVGREAIATAMLLNAMFSVAGGLVVSRFIDRYGTFPLIIIPLFGIPLLLMLSQIPADSPLLVLAVGVTGISVQGTLQGLFTISGFFYPTAIRGGGVSAAIFVSRFGSVLGPMLAGLLIAGKSPMAGLLQACSIPLAFATVATALLALFERARPSDPSTALLPSTR